MPEYRTVCRRDELAEGFGKAFYVGDKAIALFLIDGQVHAIDDTCPHMGASLAGGFVDQMTVTCPWHFWRFRLGDGAWADNPRLGVGCYKTRIEGEDVQVEIPDAPATA